MNGEIFEIGIVRWNRRRNRIAPVRNENTVRLVAEAAAVAAEAAAAAAEAVEEEEELTKSL